MSCSGWWSAETWQHLIAFLYLWANFTGHLCFRCTNTACVFQSWCGFYLKVFQGLACLLVIEHERETDVVWQTEDLFSVLHSFWKKLLRRQIKWADMVTAQSFIWPSDESHKATMQGCVTILFLWVRGVLKPQITVMLGLKWLIAFITLWHCDKYIYQYQMYYYYYLSE